MGDFNMLPDNQILLPLKEIIRDTATGFDEDALKTHPSDGADRKIDYIFATEDFTVENTYVSEKIGSDHKMIIAELSL